MEAGEEEEDLEAIQAHLDMTMALTYEAVEAAFKNSTLPDDMVYETIDTYKPRPPRLGVGAKPRDTTTNGITPSMARETARLHGRLAGKKRNREDADEDPKGTTNGLKRLHLQDSSDEEESRTATIAAKAKDKGKGKPFDKFSLPMRNKKQQPNGVQRPASPEKSTGTPTPSSGPPTKDEGKGKINPFSSKLSDDTRFVAPAPPMQISIPTTTEGDKAPSQPGSPSRLVSPTVSKASSSSRRSSTSRHLMLKHAAAASCRIVSVEPASPSIPPTRSSTSESASSNRPSTSAPTSSPKSDKQPPVLQLEPIVSPSENLGTTEDGQGKKKKRRRKKKKKHALAISQSGGDKGSPEGEDSE